MPAFPPTTTETMAKIAHVVALVKNYYLETPEDIAERVRKVLDYVPPERLSVVPDCGFS